MHAFLLTSMPSDLIVGPDTFVLQPEKSIGIEEVRVIQAFLSRKPSQEPQNRVYVVDAHLLTIPAQNALLKTLEEPPGDSLIYLITNSQDQLLPTVLSRVQIIDSLKNQTKLDTANVQTVLNSILMSTPGERVALVDSLNFTRETAIEFLNSIEAWMHENIHQSGHKIDYQKIVQTRYYLKANVNVKLALDSLFLNLN